MPRRNDHNSHNRTPQSKFARRKARRKGKAKSEDELRHAKAIREARRRERRRGAVT